MSIHKPRFLHADNLYALAVVGVANVRFICFQAFFVNEQRYLMFTILT